MRSRSDRAGTGAKTSAAATFALVFGVAGFFSVLTAILAWLGLVLGIIGIILGIVGLKMARRPGSPAGACRSAAWCSASWPC
ncbi:hypothetical protein NKG94_49905 [Micromonospora sp. M12]